MRISKRILWRKLTAVQVGSNRTNQNIQSSKLKHCHSKNLYKQRTPPPNGASPKLQGSQAHTKAETAKGPPVKEQVLGEPWGVGLGSQLQEQGLQLRDP